MAKKKLNKTERREVRLQKARQWILTYTGSHIVRAYRKRFNVDYSCALKDLGEIGALQPERLALLQHHEQIRLEQKREEREARREQEIYDRFPDSDDRFMFIAGYTSGGAPYGTTWEEMGLEPYQSIEDIPARKPAKPHPLKHVLFSELEDTEKAEIKGRLLELIDGFFRSADYIPDGEDRDEILNELCEEISDILNPWENEPCYAAYYDPIFDLEDEDDDEEVEEEPEPLRTLIVDDSLKAVFDGFVAEIVDELKQDGIELVIRMIDMAQKLSVNMTNIIFLRQDISDIEFADESFDLIVSIAALHHVPYKDTIQNCKKWLRKNGVLVILDIYQSKSILDYAYSAMACLINAVFGLVKNWKNTESAEEKILMREHILHDKYMTLSEIRSITKILLPNASVKRHLFWRYSLIWCKEER